MSPPARALLVVLALAACSTGEPTPVPQPLQPADAGVPDAVVQRALESLASGRTIRWNDRATGETGTVTPLRTFRIGGGQYCRDYEVSFTGADGRSLIWSETACRFDDANWRAPDSSS